MNELQMIPAPLRTSITGSAPGTVVEVERGPRQRNQHLISCPGGCGHLWLADNPVLSGSVEGSDLTLTGVLDMTWQDPVNSKVPGCEWRGHLTAGVFTPL